MNNKKKIKLSMYINLFILLFVMGSFVIFNDFHSDYFRLGWSSDFEFVSVNIDTGLKYFCLCLLIIITNISDVLINEIADPILYFNTYNPDKKIISEFTKKELILYSNTIFLIHLLKKFIQVLISVSQIDVAIISIISTQVSGIIAIHLLLKEKKFVSKNHSQIQMNSHPVTETTPFYQDTRVFV